MVVSEVLTHGIKTVYICISSVSSGSVSLQALPGCDLYYQRAGSQNDVIAQVFQERHESRVTL